MKTEFLKELGLEEEIISKIQAESGKDIQKEKDKYLKLEEDIKEKVETIESLNAKINELDGNDVKVQELNKQIEEYQAKENERIANEEKAKKDAEMSSRFEKVIGEKKFLNDIVKEALMNKFKTNLEDENNKSKSDVEIYEELTKDVEGIYENPNKPIDNLSTGNVDTNTINDDKVREIMGLKK